MPGSVFIIFIFILVFSPLAFGTVEPWSLTIMTTSCFLAFFVLLLRNIRDKNPFLYEIPGIIPLTLLLAFILLQILPLPVALVKIISPATYTIYRDTIFADQETGWISLSMSKKKTLTEFFRISSYVAFYALTIQLLTKKDNLIRTMYVIALFASALSLFGILQHILSNNKIYWVRELSQGGHPFGPYVNRNHYAGLMEMLFPVILGLFLFYKPRVARRSFRERITEMFDQKWTNVYLLLGFSAVMIATSIFLSLSRSGIVSLCLSMMIFGFFFVRRATDTKRGIIIIAVFILIVLFVGWFGWNIIFERFELKRSHEGADISAMRIPYWKDSLKIVRDFPLAGTGFGSFSEIFPKYQSFPPQQVGGKSIDHAHNDYIEILANGGGVSFLLCAAFLVILFYKSYRVLLRRHESYSIYLYIGSITGIISILIHSVTDFNLQIGANGLYFFFLAGLIVSAANTRLRDGQNSTYLKKVRIATQVFMSLLCIVMITGLIFQAGITIGKYSFSSAREKKLDEHISRDDLISLREKASRASFFDPLESEYRYATANMEKRLLRNEEALHAYRRAVQLSPVNSEYLQRLGLLLSEFSRHDGAEKLLLSGIHFDPDNPERYKRYALWLLARGRKDDGIRVLREGISFEPLNTRQYITIMVLNRLSDEDIQRAIPDRVEPHLLFADYLSRTGQERMAEEEYLRALSHIGNEHVIDPTFFHAVSNFYVRKERYEDALGIMTKAVEFLPDNPDLRLTLAGLYEKLHLRNRAIAVYKQVLLIDPKNQPAKKRLEMILSEEK